MPWKCPDLCPGQNGSVYILHNPFPATLMLTWHLLYSISCLSHPHIVGPSRALTRSFVSWDAISALDNWQAGWKEGCCSDVGSRMHTSSHMIDHQVRTWGGGKNFSLECEWTWGWVPRITSIWIKKLGWLWSLYFIVDFWRTKPHMIQDCVEASPER